MVGHGELDGRDIAPACSYLALQEIAEHGNGDAIRDSRLYDLAQVPDALAQCLEAVRGNLSDCEALVGERLQQAELLHVGRTVNATAVCGAFGNDRVITAFPDPDRMVAQPCQPGDGADTIAMVFLAGHAPPVYIMCRRNFDII